MVIWIYADLFDHVIPYSSVKWTPGLVSSILEELRILCPNKMLTQSKWLELLSSRMSVAEAQCYWSTFLSLRASLLGQFGDWIDLPTLGIMLLCQAYPNVKARADSFHRNEALVQTLATTIAVSPGSPLNRGNSTRNTSNLIISKLARDNACITQFVLDNLPLLIGISSVCRVFVVVICCFLVQLNPRRRI